MKKHDRQPLPSDEDPRKERRRDTIHTVIAVLLFLLFIFFIVDGFNCTIQTYC